MVSRRPEQERGGIVILIKVAAEDESTSDLLQEGEPVDGVEGGVVLDGQSTSGRFEQGERDVGQHLVVGERDLGDLGDVAGGERLHVVVLLEAHRLVDGGEVGHVELLHVANVHEVGPRELRHVDNDGTGTVVLQRQGLGDVGKVRVPRYELAVVVDVDGVNAGNIETVQGADEGVADADRRDLGDAGSTECDGREEVERLPADAADAAQRRELEAAELVEIGQVEDARDGVDRRARQADQAPGIRNDKRVDLLGPVEIDLCDLRVVDVDCASNDVTPQARCLRSTGDSNGVLRAGRCACRCDGQHLSRDAMQHGCFGLAYQRPWPRGPRRRIRRCWYAFCPLPALR